MIFFWPVLANLFLLASVAEPVRFRSALAWDPAPGVNMDFLLLVYRYIWYKYLVRLKTSRKKRYWSFCSASTLQKDF